MKKLTALLISVVLLSMTACTQNKSQSQMKTLVAYFSATGTTRAAAEKLAKEHNADLFEIEPREPYTAADLDWTNKQSRSTLEMNDPASRPAVKAKVSDLGQYDTVYVGFPIWWYTAPTIINTFLEENDLSGKVVIPFATSGGSNVTKAANDLKAAYPGCKWQKGLLLN